MINWFHVGRLVIISTVMTLLVGNVIYAEQLVVEKTVEIALNEDILEVRTRLQSDYVLNVGKESIRFLNNYQDQHNNYAVAEIFNQFKGSLLKNGTDPMIQAIDYKPKQSITITMRNTPFIEANLQGKTFSYSLVADNWVFDSEKSTISELVEAAGDAGSALSPHLTEPFRSMRVISDYCARPLGYKYSMPGSWSDLEWCPAWYSVVMPRSQYSFNEGVEYIITDGYLQEPSRSMLAITNFCNNPKGYKYPMEGSLSDSEWCPAWHAVIMPPQ